MDVKVGWIVKWHTHFGEKTGKVVDIVRDDGHVSYYISEQRGTQGFPGMSRPMLVSCSDIIEVVSREA